MSDFFQRLAAQSALRIEGDPAPRFEGTADSEPGPERDIEVVETEAESTDNPPRTRQDPKPPAEPWSHPDTASIEAAKTPVDPGPVQSPTEARSRSPEAPADSTHEPDAGPAEEASAPPVGRSPVENPDDPGAGPEEQPVHAAFEAVLRWIADGERESSHESPPDFAPDGSGARAAAAPAPAADSEQAPGSAPVADPIPSLPIGKHAPPPVRNESESESAALRAESTPPQRDASAPPGGIESPAPPARPERREAPDFHQAPSVTIGSIQITVDGGQGSEPAPRPPAPERPARNADAMYFRRRYIIPH